LFVNGVGGKILPRGGLDVIEMHEKILDDRALAGELDAQSCSELSSGSRAELWTEPAELPATCLKK
jgi:hypothetical protein